MKVLSKKGTDSQHEAYWKTAVRLQMCVMTRLGRYEVVFPGHHETW